MNEADHRVQWPTSKRSLHTIGKLALTASLTVSVVVPAPGQIHAGSHERARGHGPGHVRPDSATPAAMHALLHGRWTGTFTSHGTSGGMVMSVTQDSLHRLKLTVTTDQPKQGGAASDLVLVDDNYVRWTQDLAGTKCKASAVLKLATATSREVSAARCRAQELRARSS